MWSVRYKAKGWKFKIEILSRFFSLDFWLQVDFGLTPEENLVATKLF